MESVKRFGLSCALALPLRGAFNIDYPRLASHARRSLDAGCSSITVFGTTGEGASVSLAERERILDALSAEGIQLDRQILGGVAAASVGDAVEQARAIIARGCRRLLMAPPFYFKNVTEDGLYGWFARVCEEIGDRGCEIILYHIPPVTEVAISGGLIGRLKQAFPEIVTGVKDSGGDWSFTEELLKTHSDLLILIGNERHLSAGIRAGAKGAISGIANLCPEILLKVIESGVDDPRLSRLANEILKFPVVPAVKALLAHRSKDPAWSGVRPPLTPLSDSEAANLSSVYDRIVS
jgi:4-hydroxy-tetrahydrodipicolinate synthase